MVGNHPKLSGILTGLAVTALCSVYFFFINPEHKLELIAFDYRMRDCSVLEATSPIVHVDIDDNALERVGRWPWPRYRLAELVRILDGLGARIITLDLLLSEHEAPFVKDQRYTRGSDVEPGVATRGSISDQDVIFGDLELADAIRTAGNVFLPTQLDLRFPDQPETGRSRIRRLWDERGPLTRGETIKELSLEDIPEIRRRADDEILRLQVRDVLLRDFTTTDSQLASLLETELTKITALIAGIKRDVARELVVRRFAADEDDPTLDQVLESVLGTRKNIGNADRTDVCDAYREQLGLASVRQAANRLDPDVAARCSRAVSAMPAHFWIGRAAQDVGAVNFRTDADGGTRRIPLLVNYQGRAIKHLGFAVACHILGLDPDRITFAGDRLLSIPHSDGSEPLEVPLDKNGNLIINWTQTAKDWRESKDFLHISAAKIWVMADAREQIEQNNIAMAYTYADVVAVAKGEFQVGATDRQTITAQADHTFRRKVNEYLEMWRRIHLAGLRQDLSSVELGELQRQADVAEDYIDAQQKEAVSFIEQTCNEIDAISPEEFERDSELQAEANRFRWALNLIKTDIAQLQAANRNLEESARSIARQLTPHIKGKYVFVGFAATAEGDIVATPIDPRTIGVMCHAQVLNSFLQNKFIKRADLLGEIIICLGLGALVSMITATCGPRFALLASIGLTIAYALLNVYVVFARLGIWLDLAAITITMTVTWAAVTLFRQLTAERERRFFAKQLSQYTSPAIAARIAESPEAANAFKTVQSREMSCFFSDLQGFTTITEQEDAEVVQYVLNNYLEQMSQSIWSNQGLINKFMGDGIMAFFNSSVVPLADHQRVACETGLTVFDELHRLKHNQKTHSASPIFDRLHMRVGIASGICKNGDLGSDLKADYTVIGDVVNVAARLEPANKVFGTRVMVSGPTREAVQGLYEFRYLAELRVKGKAETVPVYELVCREGEITDEQREYIERFEAGVALYKQRKWDECIVHFTRLLTRKVGDLGASRYIDACQELKAFPPDDDWRGALELKEK